MLMTIMDQAIGARFPGRFSITAIMQGFPEDFNHLGSKPIKHGFPEDFNHL
jgi:hypothetical protein